MDGHQRAVPTQVHALHGRTVQERHRQGPKRPQQVHRMDRARRLLPLESGTVGLAPGLSMPPRASSTQRAHGPTKQMTSPTEVYQTGTPATGASGRHQDGSQQTSNRGGKKSTLNQGGKMSTSSQGRKPSTSNQGGKLASTGRGRKQATSGGPIDLPSEREGAGDSMWNDWYQRTLWGPEGGTSEPQGPPYPIGTAQARWEAIGQIYNHVDGKDPPPNNVASEALRAYYLGTEAQTLNTWACQILCMISEYHMASMTRGPPVTSPILPGVIEDRLPPLTDYALPGWA